MSIFKELKKAYPKEAKEVIKKFLQSPCCEEDKRQAKSEKK
ncbi:MAG: hypothetical protein AABW85_03650 [archaeon]